MLWGAPASNGRGISSDSVTVWWMERGQHKGGVNDVAVSTGPLW